MPRQRADGSVPGEGSRKGRYDDIQGALTHEGEFSWADVGAEYLRSAIASVTARGDAISFAVNRGRTAGSVTILAGPDRPRFFVTTAESARSLLLALSKE